MTRRATESYAETTAYPIRNGKGGITDFVHMARDITEREKTEEVPEEVVQKARGKV